MRSKATVFQAVIKQNLWDLNLWQRQQKFYWIASKILGMALRQEVCYNECNKMMKTLTVHRGIKPSQHTG